MQLGTASVFPMEQATPSQRAVASEKVSGIMDAGIIQLHRSSQCNAAAKCGGFLWNMQ